MKRLKKYILAGTLFVLITGTLSHFVYEWSGKNFILGLFFPVNESTWEHMKLCFFPMLVCSFYLKVRLQSDYPCIWSALLAGTLIATFLIPVIFYTYTGILGQHFLTLDIATFVLSVLLGFSAVYHLAVSCKGSRYLTLLRILTAMMTFSFVLSRFLWS